MGRASLRAAGIVLGVVAWLGCGSSGGGKRETCTPADCAAAGASCGQVSDGCGGFLQCGGCPEGQTCGGGGTANACGAPACHPATCQSLGKNCGQVDDGCGGRLECGSCPQGQVCGGAGTPNVCGTPAAGCTRTTCAKEGKTCGTIPDGCGGTLDCGACGSGKVCTASNTCGPAPCTPTTCAAQGKDCGRIEDACGGTLDCGACPEGQTCGGGGNQNVCAVPAPAPTVRWYATVSTPGPDVYAAVGADEQGSRVLLSTTIDEAGPGGGTLRLEKRDHDGKAVWSKTFTYAGWPVFRMAVTRLGNVLLAIDPQCWGDCTGRPGIDLGGGAIQDSALVKLGPDGRHVWTVSLAGSSVNQLASDDSGSALLFRSPRQTYAPVVEKYSWEGKPLWSKASQWVDAISLAPTGEAYVAGHSSSGLVDGAPAPASGTWTAQVVKLGTDGKFQWSVQSATLGYFSGIGTTSKGTLVLLADRAGTVTWGDSTVDNGGLVLAVLEADGKPRWARGVERLWPALLGVDPTGRAAVAGNPTSCLAVTVRTFDLANTPLWTRTVPTNGQCGSTRAQALSYGADHEVTVGGTFGGTIVVGEDTLVPQGDDGIAVELAP
ncbi:hypothetical protein [Anaeromyxobacter sp. K]|uniref:hypothetical protein n=1 Tax=Anaeromyxobacter sp. (strain K) TaxID=447217 RepID=UPI00015F9EF8|nr:hypothetical protein [Anaeromyxobacter sp. K]